MPSIRGCSVTTPLLVLNQSQSPGFQRMVEAAAAPAPVAFLNGQGFPVSRPGVEVRPAPTYDRRSAPHRLVSWLRYVAAAVAYAARQDAFVLAVTNPPLLPHVAWALSRVRGIRYGLLVWDIYPGHLHEMGWLNPSSVISRAWETVNDTAYNRAEFVVTIGEQMADSLRRRSTRTSAVQIIPNWADTELIRPLPRDENPLRGRLAVRDEMVVMYSGNLGATHGLDGLLNAADALRGNSQICFRVVGQGLGRAALEAAIKTRALSNVRVFDPVSWQDFPFVQALADVAVVAQAPGTEHLSVPSKSYSALAAGSALLALTEADSDLGRLVERHRLGRVCGFHATQAITSTLRGWCENEPELRAYQRRAREVAVSDFSLERITAAWREVLAAALADGRPRARAGSGSPKVEPW